MKPKFKVGQVIKLIDNHGTDIPVGELATVLGSGTCVVKVRFFSYRRRDGLDYHILLKYRFKTTAQQLMFDFMYEKV